MNRLQTLTDAQLLALVLIAIKEDANDLFLRLDDEITRRDDPKLSLAFLLACADAVVPDEAKALRQRLDDSPVFNANRSATFGEENARP
jgi:hypothetical protein